MNIHDVRGANGPTVYTAITDILSAVYKVTTDDG